MTYHLLCIFHSILPRRTKCVNVVFFDSNSSTFFFPLSPILLSVHYPLYQQLPCYCVSCILPLWRYNLVKVELSISNSAILANPLSVISLSVHPSIVLNLLTKTCFKENNRNNSDPMQSTKYSSLKTRLSSLLLHLQNDCLFI